MFTKELPQPKIQNAIKASCNHSTLIDRGRLALSQAEEHIQIFEKYLNQSHSFQKSTDEIVARLGSNDLIESDDKDSINSTDSLFEIQRPTPFLDHLIQERHHEIENAVKKEESSHEVKLRKVSQSSSIDTIQRAVKSHRQLSFDPTRLYKIGKSRGKEENMHIESGKQHEFKALPLPGGAKVNSNLYALTKAAKGKMSNKLSDSKGNNEKFFQGNTRVDASTLLNNNASKYSESHQSPPLNTSENRPTKRKNGSIHKKIYQATTNHVESSVSDGFDDDYHNESNDITDDEDFETVKGLQLQIAKLRADLRCKKLKCISTIQALEQEAQSEDVHEILGIPVNIDDIQSSNDERNHSHQVQVRRETLEKDTYGTITPHLKTKSGNKSWVEAKIAHDKLLEMEQERELKLKAERTERELLNQQKQIEASEQILRVAREKMKTMKKNIDKNKQLEYADRLSRSKTRDEKCNEITVEDSAMKNNSSTDYLQVPDIDTKRMKNSKDQHNIQSSSRMKKVNTGAKSYADMDDEEFANMIKDIQFQAKKKVRQEVKIRKSQVKFQKNSEHLPSGSECISSPYDSYRQL